MNKLHITVFSCCLIFMASCGLFDTNCQEINGDTLTQTVNFDRFNELQINVPANVMVSEGTNQSVTFTGPSDLIELLESDSEVTGSQLKLDIDGCVDYNQADLQIDIVVNSIEKIMIDGAARVESGNVLMASTDMEVDIDGAGEVRLDLGSKGLVKLKVDGAGTIELTGSCNTQNIDLSGSAKIRNRTMETLETAIRISGAGDAELYASQSLEVTISGAADVCYDGDPLVTQEISGAGSIMPCE